MTAALNSNDEPSSEGVLHCYRHPKIETRLRCSRCGNPICTKCARRTPVGFRCPQCISNQQAAFYTATPVDYAVAVVVAFVLSFLAAMIMRPLGWFFAIFLGPIAGGLIAEAIHRAVGRRRGHWIGVVVVACIVVSALLPAAPSLLGVFLSIANPSAFTVQTWLALLQVSNPVYVILASITAYARLR